MAILNDNEFVEVEGRGYVNPQVALDESNTFIDNLRSTQQANNQQIQTDTYNLGTEIPSNLGGLTGAESYFTSRYQTPQTVSAVANLRATAQATALNQVLANEEAMWKKRYNDAYRRYQKSSYDKTYNQNPTTTYDGENINADNTTVDVGSVSTEALARSMYLKKFQEYINQGLTAAEAEARAKADMGIGGTVDTSTNNNGIQRQKSTIGGGSAYVYTLPNGRTVLVDESKFELVQTSNGYVLKNLETGATTEVGN